MRAIALTTWNVLLAAWVVAVIIVIIWSSAAGAHEMNGTDYRDWTNQRGGNCCNGKDCDEVDNKDVREVGDHYEIRIGGEWCEVQKWQFTKTGNNPNGYVNHACILPYQAEWAAPGPCGRLVCFRPSTGF